MLCLTILSFISLLAVSVVAIVSRDLSQAQLEGGLVSRLRAEYGMPGGEELTRVVDLVQTELECCGVTGPGDYAHSDWQADPHPSVRLPLTCCTLSPHHLGPQTFLQPSPLNRTLCQSQQPEDRFRHIKVEWGVIRISQR